jgi:hypothetical protein
MANKTKVIHENGPTGWVLFTAWVGALVYFVNQAQGFWEVILAFLKACVWPAYLLYEVLSNLGV